MHIAEPDETTDRLHPRFARRLIGQEAAESRLLQAYLSCKMHQAWILAGPHGIGKATLAYRFARFMLARQYYNLGQILKQLGKTDLAEEQFRKAKEIRGNRGRRETAKGQGYARRKIRLPWPSNRNHMSNTRDWSAIGTAAYFFRRMEKTPAMSSSS